MFTCPWCGTSYPAFQTNCSNCGGPLLPTQDRPTTVDDPGEAPPPPPRPISERYAWRLLWSDAWSIVGFIFGILGLTFTLVGGGLMLATMTAIVGIPFLALGLPLLTAGGALLIWRHDGARRVVGVLRDGDAARGQITEIREQRSVSVQGAHPWIIGYKFQVNGRSYGGKVTTLNRPGAGVQPGNAAWILYSSEAPQWSSIYPHP